MRPLPSGFITLYVLRKIKGGVYYLPVEGRVDEVVGELQAFGVPAFPGGEITRWTARLPGQGVVVVGTGEVRAEVLTVRSGVRINLDALALRLTEAGFERGEFAERPGEFAIRGGIIDVVFSNAAFRVILSGDEVEEVREFSPYTQISTGKVEGFLFLLPSETPLRGEVISLPENPAVRFNPPFGDFKRAARYVRSMRERGYSVFFAGNPVRLALFEGSGVRLLRGNLYEGFVDEEKREVYIGEWEVVGARPTRGEVVSKVRVKAPRYLEPGDYVVHEDYGVGVFLGLERRKVGEVILLQYSDGRLSVPVYKAHKLTRYVGPEGYSPPISSLNRKAWERDRAKAILESSRIARELLNIMVSRRVPRGFTYPPVPEEREFRATFPYTETEDQIKAIEEVLSDLESEFIMDRLLVGEVAFGKTEVALRAAFRVLSHGRSVVWLVPSTLLAYQHYRNMASRLEPFGIPVYMISRMSRKFGEGPALYVGTHALLRMEIPDLGLVVVDEEQHFGVLQKERFKRYNPKVDYLYLSATPIPRTLGMGLEGLIDVSYIRTPPPGRLPVFTYIGEYSDDVVVEAVQKELERGGQVFYVFNRVEGLERVLERLRKLLPGVPMEMLHGRMPKRRIREVMDAFYGDRVKVLVSTAIVEAGLDFRNANTLIVERPELLGLSQLHQLRGRVGRWTVQAYAHFLYRPPLRGNAKRRLEYLAMYSSLGEGYKLALRDLEIRGMGELLGVKQHGRVAKVGFKLYLKFIRRAIGLEGEGREYEDRYAHIPEDYIRDPDRRVEYYVRFADAQSPLEVDRILSEMRDIFGDPPEAVLRLANLHRKRLSAVE